MALFAANTERERQLEALRQERRRMATERALAPRLRKEFRRLAKLMQKEYIGGTVERSGLQIHMEGHQENIEKMLARAYALSINQMVDYVVQEAQREKSWVPVIEQKDTLGTIQALISHWIHEEAHERSQFIAETSWGIVDETLVVGAAEGLSSVEVGKMINTRLGGPVSASRARMIARTETHASAQNASLELTKKIPLPPMNKVWVAHTDKRTRDHHREINGDTAAMNETFNVGDSTMQYPGDPSGGGSEVINCRCVLTYDSLH